MRGPKNQGNESTESPKLIANLEEPEHKHKRMERKFRDSEVRYRRLFETAQDGILILDAETGQINDVNPFLIDMLGYSKKEFLGKKLWEISPFKDTEAAQKVFSDLQSKGYIRYEHLPLETKEGRLVAVEFVSNAYAVNGKKVIQCNVRDITKRWQSEESLRASRQFLEIANRHSEMTPMLQEFVKALKEWTDCAAVGIRLLDNEGNIPYEAYQGFSQAFYDSESPLSIKSDQCMCINVIKGTTDSRLSYYTEGGSFYMNTTSRFLATVSDEEKGETRNVCNSYGYESVGLIPIRSGTRILGLIHVADFREDMVPLALVQTLERVAMELGAAIQRISLTQALKESEERFRGIYLWSPLGIELYDENGQLLEANRACLDIFGVSDVAQVKGVRLFDDWNINDEAKEELRQGRTVRYEAPIDFDKVKKRRMYNTNRSGTIHISAFISPLGVIHGNKPGGYLVLIQDTTTSKKLDELKDEFIGLVSHELRTPLTVIMGALNVLSTSEISLSVEERHGLIQDAVSETEELSTMLTNLLELSRAQAGRLSLYTEPVSIDTVVKDVVERMRQRSPTHEYNIDLPGRLPRIHADTQRLEHILHNLLDNAVKYSSQGSEIRVFGKEEDRRLIIGVSDQGRGISPDDQAKLFKPFGRVIDGAVDAIKGTGLGLLVCLRLVEAHGGRIWLESEPGRGSTFFFSLPTDKKGT